MEPAEQPSVKPDILLTPPEACKYLTSRTTIPVNVGRLTSWRQRNQGPAFVKFVGKVFYSKTALNAFVHEQIKGGQI